MAADARGERKDARAAKIVKGDWDRIAEVLRGFSGIGEKAGGKRCAEGKDEENKEEEGFALAFVELEGGGGEGGEEQGEGEGE